MKPDEYTIQELSLDVGNGHSLYVQDWGKAEAIPIVYLHGGPGGGVSDRHKFKFEPTKQRVIFYDQRGCGKSTPYGSTQHNTTQDLVEDIQKIASKLGLNQFIITGNSWGSCLALAYALKHPGRIKTMVLQGIFTGSKSEVDYLVKGLFKTHYPEAWGTYISSTPVNYHKDPSAYHLRRITGENELAAIESAKIYGTLISSIMSLDDRLYPDNEEEFDYKPLKIESYYILNDCFMPDQYILNNAHKITVPIWLVHGRYDFVCPPETAYELNRKLPNSQLIWTMAGHGNDRNNYEVMRSLLLQAGV